jgi:hypothetical protein
MRPSASCSRSPCPARPARPTSCASRRAALGLHQPLEFPAGHLHRPGRGRAGHRQHVLAKPAEQTPGVAGRPSSCCMRPACPKPRCSCCTAPATPWAPRWWRRPGIAGVVFTGSTQVAKIINRALAAKDGPIVPLIAETGGINAMLVDSTALPEQVADAVVQSAFRSAGQRCSALRLLCVHEGIADHVIEMIKGAAQELAAGETGRPRHRRRPGDRPRSVRQHPEAPAAPERQRQGAGQPGGAPTGRVRPAGQPDPARGLRSAQPGRRERRNLRPRCCRSCAGAAASSRTRRP